MAFLRKRQIIQMQNGDNFKFFEEKFGINWKVFDIFNFI